MTAPTDLVARIALLLERLGIAYHVGGSVASSWYGVPRTTSDVDLVIEADAGQLRALAEALSGEFYVSGTAMAEALAERRSFNAVSLRDPLKIDFFVCGDRPFDREEFRRARSVDLGGEPLVRLQDKSAEDLVLRKLEWFRHRGAVSERQWSDVLGILRAMAGRLDESYLDRWARELGISDLLAKARSEAAAA